MDLAEPAVKAEPLDHLAQVVRVDLLEQAEKQDQAVQAVKLDHLVQVG
jgi:hypothetical protein